LIVAYVSGHGFGHVVRTAEVLRAVREQEPRMPVTVVTSADSAFARRTVPAPAAVRPLECDVGLAQRDALSIDEAETLRRWRAFQALSPEWVRDEAGWLRRVGARVVLGDVPPLAFDAAAEAGVPGVALANFSWDWVYRHLAGRLPALAEAAEACAASYRRTGVLLELPFAGDLGAFPRREPVGLLARRPGVDRREARRRLGLPGGPLVLLSFGGLGLPCFDPRVLAGLAEFHFVTAGEWPALPGNATGVPATRLEAAGLGYHDLVGAADVVVTKPGYGIVSDAIGAGTRIVYTERGDFPEYAVLVEGMKRYLPCAHVANADLLAGRLRPALSSVLAEPACPSADTGGATTAARRLLELAA
jgi:L-arabinokinase